MPIQETSPADDSATLAAQVADLLAPHWPAYRARWRQPAGAPDEVPFDALVSGPGMRRHLDDFCDTRPGQDRRGMASLWIQWYLVVAWPPLFTAALLCGRLPELEGPHAALVLDAEGKPEAIAAGDPVQVLDEPDPALDALVHAHAAPLIEQLSCAADMAPRVAWSNASNVLGWYLAEARAFADADALAPGWRLLREPVRGNGMPNPLHVPGAATASPGERPARRVCCLRYRLDTHPYCTDCPITPERRIP